MRRSSVFTLGLLLGGIRKQDLDLAAAVVGDDDFGGFGFDGFVFVGEIAAILQLAGHGYDVIAHHALYIRLVERGGRGDYDLVPVAGRLQLVAFVAPVAVGAQAEDQDPLAVLSRPPFWFVGHDAAQLYFVLMHFYPHSSPGLGKRMAPTDGIECIMGNIPTSIIKWDISQFINVELKRGLGVAHPILTLCGKLHWVRQRVDQSKIAADIG